ncbi:hypothetical protein GYMLUDRAFT_380629 [Collybiopsis luxurians FD-317 M1]|nr:hypothetical protein GYMLUDRAFT_380629 [Collybiopsis luxurians FD-317 M1]
MQPSGNDYREYEEQGQIHKGRSKHLRRRPQTRHTSPISSDPDPFKTQSLSRGGQNMTLPPGSNISGGTMSSVGGSQKIIYDNRRYETHAIHIHVGPWVFPLTLVVIRAFYLWKAEDNSLSMT